MDTTTNTTGDQNTVTPASPAKAVPIGVWMHREEPRGSGKGELTHGVYMADDSQPGGIRIEER